MRPLSRWATGLLPGFVGGHRDLFPRPGKFPLEARGWPRQLTILLHVNVKSDSRWKTVAYLWFVRNFKLLKKTLKTVYCRRHRTRKRTDSYQVRCWVEDRGPQTVQVIEVDRRGGRLVLPWEVEDGETVHVAFIDELGFCQTVRGRVAWSQKLVQANHHIAGIAFETGQKRAA